MLVSLGSIEIDDETRLLIAKFLTGHNRLASRVQVRNFAIEAIMDRVNEVSVQDEFLNA